MIFPIFYNDESAADMDIRPQLQRIRAKIDRVIVTEQGSVVSQAGDALGQFTTTERALGNGLYGWSGDDADACLEKLKELHKELRRLRDEFMVNGNKICLALSEEMETPSYRM